MGMLEIMVPMESMLIPGVVVEVEVEVEVEVGLEDLGDVEVLVVPQEVGAL